MKPLYSPFFAILIMLTSFIFAQSGLGDFIQSAKEKEEAKQKRELELNKYLAIVENNYKPAFCKILNDVLFKLDSADVLSFKTITLQDYKLRYSGNPDAHYAKYVKSYGSYVKEIKLTGKYLGYSDINTVFRTKEEWVVVEFEYAYIDSSSTKLRIFFVGKNGYQDVYETNSTELNHFEKHHETIENSIYKALKERFL